MICALCSRNTFLEMHHLIPKSRWRRVRKTTTWEERHETVDLCVSCHDHVHDTFTVTELAREYNTLEKLAAEPAIQKFVGWIKTKPADFVATRKRMK